MSQSPQMSPDPTPNHPMPVVMRVVFCGLVITGVTAIRLIIAGHQKVTENGVTTLSYRWEHVAVGVFLGMTTYAASSLLCRGRFMLVKGLFVAMCGILAIGLLSADTLTRLDSDGIFAQTLLSRRSVAFADVQRVTFTEELKSGYKGQKFHSYSVVFQLNSGESIAWPAGSVFEVEKELRTILESRGIALVNEAPSRQSELTEAEKAAARAEYERNLLQSRGEAEHNALRGSEWRSTFETTLTFSDDNAIIVGWGVRSSGINETWETTYRATYERAGTRYRFTFEDGSSLEAEIKMFGPDVLKLRNGVATGEAASQVSEWVKTSFHRCPPQSVKAPE